MIEAVVFDVDGVLIDSEPVWERVRRGFVAERGGRWPDDAQDRMMGMSTAEWSRYISEDFGVALAPEQVAERVVTAMAAEYQEHLPLLPGAVEAVRALSGRWRLAVASSAPKSLIEAVLDASGLRPAFAASVSSEEVDPRQAGPRRLPRGRRPPRRLAGAVRRRRGLLQRPALCRGGRPHGHRRPPPRVPAGPRRPRPGPGRPRLAHGADPRRYR